MTYALYFLLLLVGNTLIFLLLDFWQVIVIEHTFATYFLVTFVLSLFHLVLKPLLKIISFPLLILTFGAFSIVINMALLWLTDYIVAGLMIPGFLPLLYTTLLLSLFHVFVHSLFERN